MGEGEKDYSRVELVWPGKRTQVERVKLPFQVIERVNDVRRSEFGQAPLLGTELPLEWPDNWRNKLIWGDNKYVLASLLDEFAGKVDLIYIDPPFASGQDFSVRLDVGEQEVLKRASIVEETAYRDTWGRGLESYLQMMYERLLLIRDFLSERGSLFLHLDEGMAPYLRPVLDEIFGHDAFVNLIVWKRSDAHSDVGQGALHLGRVCDHILYYARHPGAQIVNMQFKPLPSTTADRWYRHVEEGTGRRFNKADITGPGGARKGNPVYEWKGITRAWRFSKHRMEQLETDGRLVYSDSGMVYLKRYLDESKGVPLQDLWDDIGMVRGIHTNSEGVDYATQKPQALLERIVSLASNEGSLVADFFCGSGTTMAVAERLGRRWIGCDLGRFAIQTSRKRLLEMRARPFEVLNLGRYERKYWQGVMAGEAIAEYYRFIVELFHGEVIPGFTHLHGIKAGHLIHVGATDAPVTEAELRSALTECKANGFTDLDVLGWEWEMGLNRDGAARLARDFDVKLRLFNIPREVMDKRAVEAGDVHFFELSVAELQPEVSNHEAIIELCGFLPAIDEYMRSKVGDADLKWSDWIDYWSIDFEYDGETFINQWQSYRTRKNRTLALRSDPHRYDKPGTYRVVVKIIDIFGNDTTQELSVTMG